MWSKLPGRFSIHNFMGYVAHMNKIINFWVKTLNVVNFAVADNVSVQED